MKIENKKRIFIGIIFFLLIICSVFFKTTGTEENETTQTIQNEAEVTNRTITTTLTAPGEVKSAIEEKLSLNTSYSFLNMCVEENEEVKAGSNILKYTNGTYLTAPYDCVILEYSVPTVNNVCTTSNYISIASTDNLYMDINISEEQIDKIIVGQEVDIVANYDESKTYKGTISKINAIGTHSNGGTSFAAVASIENDDNLKIGMSATCTVTIEKAENLPCLPIEAIQIENDEKFVNLITENGEVKRVQVETGRADANYVEIVSGVSLGDKVSYETTIVTNANSDDLEKTKSLFSSLFEDENNPSGRNRERGGF